ncbi:tetratricopeptide repeat protein [Azospirillum sp. YIM B02556]|uniref:Tetratricopeptide repeat protein n=1 Tax=Azospirillum endophyticum TaxID=2800326 RepID=A0ABS1FBE3_9PROT|nr:tetratricopeptide repeat protein [Azospirillum endophyticum]MBK1840749.1 tetratricopeptide repeat protein [Azospirillum endophyticum]
MSLTQQILARAVERHRAGETDGAAPLYRLALALAPDQPDALHLLGLLTRRQGRLADGVTLMARALRVAPGLGAALGNQARALIDQGRLEEAMAHLRRKLAVEPSCRETLVQLGGDALARGSLDEAEPLLRRALALGGDGANGRAKRALDRCATARVLSAEAAAPSLPPGLVVRGVFRDSSGYAYKVRRFVHHLVAAGIRIRLVDLNHGDVDLLPDGQIAPLLDTLHQPVRAKAVLSFTTPPAVEAVPGLKTITYTVFEAAQILPSWAAYSRRHDHVVVATESSRAAWLRAGHPADRIHLCPEGVEAVPEGLIHPLPLVDGAGRRLADFPVRILNVSDFNSRKNLVGLLRVWLRTTRPGDPAALALKLGKGGRILEGFQALLQQAVAETGRSLPQAAPIFLVEALLSDTEMLSLYASGTHYWSMSHGEGWDLPMTQAGAMGLTLLAPDHSAYQAYVDGHAAHMIPSWVTPAFHGYQGQDWWTPDEGEASRLLRAVIDDPAGTRRSAQSHLLDQFSWKKAADRLVALLKELDAL